MSGFKPQRGKFTHAWEMDRGDLRIGFKPQRGKFTHGYRRFAKG